MQINLIKISSQYTKGYSKWELYSKELERFFEFWLKKKLNTKADIHCIDYYSSDSKITLSRLDLITKLMVNQRDINIFILDQKPTDFTSSAKAFLGLNWAFILFDPHPVGVLYSLTRRISHELLHYVLREAGFSKLIWVNKVDADAQIGNLPMDYWRKTVAQYLYGFIFSRAGYMKQKRRTNATLYSTQGGEYLELINEQRKRK